jgi:hypothetical protein
MFKPKQFNFAPRRILGRSATLVGQREGAFCAGAVDSVYSIFEFDPAE